MSKLGEKARERNQAMFRLTGIRANLEGLIKTHNEILSEGEKLMLDKIVTDLKLIRANKDNAWKIVKKILGYD